MDWNNVDLNNSYESAQNILDGYSFDQLLEEIYCNIPTQNINFETVKKQFEESMRSKYQCAWDVFASNVDSIVKKAKEDRKDK